MKIKHAVIEVQQQSGIPTHIQWRGKLCQVQNIIDTWLYRSRWWAAEECRHYWWLQCEDVCVEVFERQGRWFRSRVWD